MNNFGFYALALIGLVLGFYAVKKITTCLMKAVVTIVIIVALGAVYYLYMR